MTAVVIMYSQRNGNTMKIQEIILITEICYLPGGNRKLSHEMLGKSVVGSSDYKQR